jgi:HEAT repeat protein
LSVPLRVAFLYAIGQLDPTTDAAQRILSQALEHDERDVRLAAAKAIGSGSEIAPSTLYQYQRQQRLNVRSAGAGNE